MPSAATLMQFWKFYFFVTINVTHIVTQRDRIQNLYHNHMWYYIVVSVQKFLFYIVTQRDMFKSLDSSRSHVVLCLYKSFMFYTLKLLDVI